MVLLIIKVKKREKVLSEHKIKHGLDDHQAVVIIKALIEIYRKVDPANFLVLTFDDPKTGEEFDVVIQRCAGESSAAQQTRLKAENKRLKDAMEVLSVGSCSCLTKSPLFIYHAETCNFRIIGDAIVGNPQLGVKCNNEKS